MAASMANDFVYPARDWRCPALDNVVIPAARELGLPLALMIGVRRQVNPALGLAGDAGAFGRRRLRRPPGPRLTRM